MRQLPCLSAAIYLMPIHKGKGQLADPSNYGPLSIPDVASRVWGSILNQRLLDATKDILTETMFGFRPGRRTAAPLLVLRHMIDIYLLLHLPS